MIGNADDARLALEMCESGDDSAFLSEGATRKVYKFGSVVYKVNYDISSTWGVGNTNRDEFESAHKYSDIPGVRIPNMEMYGDVLAMEYIHGELTGECETEWLGQSCRCEADHLPVGVEEALKDAGYDTTWGNVIRNSDGLWLIDMGL
jgi:hypothetical protein